MNGSMPPAPFVVPECLDFLAREKRWVGWKFEQRNGKQTKPPIQVSGGQASGYARNNDASTWASLPEALQAYDENELSGIGLELLDLGGFAAIDLDNVRDPQTGNLLPWVSQLITECCSYCEVTPSKRGVRILGSVPQKFPPQHTKRDHPEGGAFEIYANITTGRFITVSGERLSTVPDKLCDLDGPVSRLLQLDKLDSEKPTSPAFPDDRLASLLERLPHHIRRSLAEPNCSDRSKSFQSIVSSVRKVSTFDEALCLLRAFPDGPAGKYHGRLEQELRRSWQKAEQSRAETVVQQTRTADVEVNEDAVATEFLNRYGSDFRFDHDQKSWISWSGDRWARDGKQLAMHHIRTIARDMSAAASRSKVDSVRKASFISGVERLAKTDPWLAVTQDIWDRDPFLLGVRGATVDLATGRPIPACPEQYVSRQASVGLAMNTDCTLWSDFLRTVTDGDKELELYLQRLAGYVLTGDIREHALFFLYGPGGNGKSVFVNVLTGMLGDYAAIAPMSTFTATRGDRHPTELAMLRGARLVVASETEQGQAWAENRIKQLTGGEPISARFVKQDFFTFTPQFKLLIVGNHKPTLRNVDEAIRRRFQIIPFICKPKKPDKYLGEKLQNEWPGILRWALEGCLQWQKQGLAPPRSVIAETEAYLSNQDLIGQWIGDCCVVDAGNVNFMDPVGSLFGSWKEYAINANDDPGSMKSFAETLERLGFPGQRVRIDGRQMRVRIGIRVIRGGKGFREPNRDIS